MNFPAPAPHDLPEQIGDDVFVVYGSIVLNSLLRFTRNMVIVRSGDELTLINPVRMGDTGLAALDSLGTVKHVLRLGPMHGMDDPFYIDRYKAKMWGLAGGSTYTEPPLDHALVEGGELPFPDASLFVFKHMTEPEGAILLHRSPNILITTDAIQSYSTPPYKPQTSLLAKIMLPLRGFPNKTLIGPIWMQMLVDDKDGMREEFRRLLQWDFDQMICGHGAFLPRGAKAEAEIAFENMFGEVA